MNTTELLQSLVGERVAVTSDEARRTEGVLAEVTVDGHGAAEALVVQAGDGVTVIRWASVDRIRHTRGAVT